VVAVLGLEAEVEAGVAASGEGEGLGAGAEGVEGADGETRALLNQ
jgi:hypothetical protein